MDKEDITGQIVDVYVDIEPDRKGRDRWVIIIKVQSKGGEEHILRNNWDGSLETHDKKHGERLRKVRRFEKEKTPVTVRVDYEKDYAGPQSVTSHQNKKVAVSTWGDYDKEKWWKDIKEIK